MYSLGLSKKTRDKYSSQTAIDAVDEKYDTCAEFLESFFIYLDENLDSKHGFVHTDYIDDKLDTNKRYSEYSLYFRNMFGNLFLVFYPLDNIFDKVLFKITVGDFPGYHYASFYFIQVDGKVFLTNNHDIINKEIEERERFLLLYDMSKSSIIEIYKTIEWILNVDKITMKSIADALMTSGNICSGNLSLYDIENKNVIQYHHDVFSTKNKNEILSQSTYINEITFVRGEEEFLKDRYKINSISKINLEEFKKRYEEYKSKNIW